MRSLRCTAIRGAFAWLHASWTEWKNLFSLEVVLERAKIEVSGLGGSYGPETLTLYEMLPEMGPPREEASIVDDTRRVLVERADGRPRRHRWVRRRIGAVDRRRRRGIECRGVCLPGGVMSGSREGVSTVIDFSSCPACASSSAWSCIDVFGKSDLLRCDVCQSEFLSPAAHRRAIESDLRTRRTTSRGHWRTTRSSIRSSGRPLRRCWMHARSSPGRTSSTSVAQADRSSPKRRRGRARLRNRPQRGRHRGRTAPPSGRRVPCRRCVRSAFPWRALRCHRHDRLPRACP